MLGVRITSVVERLLASLLNDRCLLGLDGSANIPGAQDRGRLGLGCGASGAGTVVGVSVGGDGGGGVVAVASALVALGEE